MNEGSFDLEATGSEAAWLSWTNCSSCTPASFARVAVGPRFAARLSTNALPCSGACQFPGGYALSPAIALTSGHRQVVLRADVGATGAANLKLISFDQQGTEVSASDLAVPAGSGAVQTRFVVFPVPASATAVRLRLEQPTPNAELTLDSLSIASLP